jgi:chromosome segregation ATPase
MTIMDYLGNLPPLMQFILIFLSLSGTSGLFAGIFAILKIRETARVSKADTLVKQIYEAQVAEDKRKYEAQIAAQRERMEALESQQIRIQSEAATQREQMNIFKSMVADIPKTRETWQSIIDRMSSRRSEMEQKMTDAYNKQNTLIAANTSAFQNLTAMVELQSAHLGQLSNKVASIGEKIDGTMQRIEVLAQTNRADIQKALGSQSAAQTKYEETLHLIMAVVQGLRSDVANIVGQSAKQKDKTLQDIMIKIEAIGRSLKDMIPPPAPLDPPPNNEENQLTA